MRGSKLSEPFLSCSECTFSRTPPACRTIWPRPQDIISGPSDESHSSTGHPSDVKQVTCAPSLHPHSWQHAVPVPERPPSPTTQRLGPCTQPTTCCWGNRKVFLSACTHRTPSTSTIEPLHSTSSSSLVFAAPWTLPSTGSFRRTRTGAGPLSLQQLDSVRCQSQW